MKKSSTIIGILTLLIFVAVLENAECIDYNFDPPIEVQAEEGTYVILPAYNETRTDWLRSLAQGGEQSLQRCNFSDFVRDSWVLYVIDQAFRSCEKWTMLNRYTGERETVDYFFDGTHVDKDNGDLVVPNLKPSDSGRYWFMYQKHPTSSQQSIKQYRLVVSKSQS